MWAGAHGVYRIFTSPTARLGRSAYAQNDRDEEDSSHASFRTAEEGLYGEYSSVGRAPTTPDIRLQSPSGGIYSPSFPSTTSFRSAVSRTTRRQTAPAESARPSDPKLGQHTPASPAVASESPRNSQRTPAVPSAMTSTAPPAPASANPGLLERLKAQRADRIAQSAPPPAQAAPDTAQQPPPAPQPPKLPSPPLQPFQTPQPEAPLLSFPDVNVRDAAQAHLGDDECVSIALVVAGTPTVADESPRSYSAEYLHDFSHSYLHEPLAPSLQPAFDVAHPEQKPYLPPHASTASPLAHAYHPPSQPFVRRRDSPTHFADVECAIEPEHIPYSPWTLPPFPQQEVGRVPSRLSERTLLNEAAPVAIAAPAPPAIASPVPPAPPPNTAQLDPRSPPSAKEVGSVAEEPEDTWERRARREKRERRALLDWERAQREEDRRNRPPSASSRSSTHPSPRKYRTDVNETSHDPPPSSLPNHPLESSADPAPTPEPVLAEVSQSPDAIGVPLTCNFNRVGSCYRRDIAPSPTASCASPSNGVPSTSCSRQSPSTSVGCRASRTR